MVEGVKYNFNSKPGESHYDNSVSMVWKEPRNYLKLRALRHIKHANNDLTSICPLILLWIHICHS